VHDADARVTGPWPSRPHPICTAVGGARTPRTDGRRHGRVDLAVVGRTTGIRDSKCEGCGWRQTTPALRRSRRSLCTMILPRVLQPSSSSTYYSLCLLICVSRKPCFSHKHASRTTLKKGRRKYVLVQSHPIRCRVSVVFCFSNFLRGPWTKTLVRTSTTDAS
jgi:hypothetical protein